MSHINRSQDKEGSDVRDQLGFSAEDRPTGSPGAKLLIINQKQRTFRQQKRENVFTWLKTAVCGFGCGAPIIAPWSAAAVAAAVVAAALPPSKQPVATPRASRPLTNAIMP